MAVERKRQLELTLGPLVLVTIFLVGVDCKCSGQCKALAAYYITPGETLSSIGDRLSSSPTEIQRYNPQIKDLDYIKYGTTVNVPFSCGCAWDKFRGHVFVYKVKSNDTYQKVAETYYSNLTTVEMLSRYNNYNLYDIPDDGQLNVTVNCSCGNKRVSKDYGLFISYPLRSGQNLATVAAAFNFTQELLQAFNPTSSFKGSGLVFIPGKDENGTYPPLKLSSSGIAGGVIAGISVAGVVGVLLLAGAIYFGFYRKKKVDEESFLRGELDGDQVEHGLGPGSTLEKTSESGPIVGGATLGLTGFAMNKSVEFSLEELAKATNDFSMANKIGQGGFGSVFYGEIRGEKAAIKKMDMQASKEFLAELKVLTHVHHLNLVRLIGYCVEGSLFLVYEFIENGNLSQHLRGSGRDPLPWSTRVQIALDSARGLEYIHEHTVPVYIHRDIKSENILIDKNFRAKVADFGLTKLTEVGSASLFTRLVGTFGYMAPETRYGDVSPKIDVYAFGVVLYELISAKEAIIRTNEVGTESIGLVALFESILNNPDPKENLHKLVDPRLGDEYPLESVLKLAQLARACTREDPQLRPSMRSTVVALTILTSSTEEWDAVSLYKNEDLVHQMSGR